MKLDSPFKIKDTQMNQLDNELNDLLAQADDLEQEIQQKVNKMALLRSQLELHDPDYKTEMEKVKWVIPAKKLHEEETYF
jgi:chromosome segregation ATPase